MSSIFNKVELARCPRSRQPFHELKKLTGDMGLIYPVFNKLMMPADVWKVSLASIIKFENLRAPLFGDVYVDFFAFATPLRLLDDKDLDTPEDFEKIADVEDDTFAVPHWLPASLTECDKYTLWDYFGFGIKKTVGQIWTVGSMTAVPSEVHNTPMSYPLRAYNKVWNEYFRDEQLQQEIVWSDKQVGYNYMPLRANWNKDYFNTARENQQLGNSVLLPFGNVTGAIPVGTEGPIAGATSWLKASIPSGGGTATVSGDAMNLGPKQIYAFADDEAMTITGTINDWRDSLATQRFLERANITGTRYTEYLQANFNVIPQDSRLQRPEFCGRLKVPVITEEIIQTSETSNSSPQGNRTANAQAGTSSRFFTYHAKEWTVLQILMCVRPKSNYMADGIPHEWLLSERYDFPHPLFSKLGQEAIYKTELYNDGVDANADKIFGYTGCLDWLRVSRNNAVADFRDESYASWTFDRSVDSSVALNSDFIQCNPRKTAFANQEAPAFAAFVDVRVKAYRPIPRQGVIV